MKLSRLGEFGLIEAIRSATPKGRGVHLGIGDDAAWVEHPGGSSLITADLLIEGVHFDLRWTTMFDLGHKSLAVNLSDIAAMGGVPAYLILSLGIPSHFDSKQIAEFYRGIHSLAATSGVALIGGDTNLSEKFLISACVLGHAPYRPIPRSGARVGDDIYVTGELGDAALALTYLKSQKSVKRPELLAQLVERHHRPTPRLAVGKLLARQRLATAMIDVSDGMLQDLGHICEASHVGAAISFQDIPVSHAYSVLAGNAGLRFALTGGEDYELLFFARPAHRARIEQLSRRTQVPIARIGRCVPKNENISVFNSKGYRIQIPGAGHDHFKKTVAGLNKTHRKLQRHGC